MATLDLEVSDVDSEYSDGFLEDLSYSQSSSGDDSNNELVARLESSLAQRPSSDTSSSRQSLGKTIRTPKKSTRVASTSSESSFKEFNSSRDVREACYSEWLSRKKSSSSFSQQSQQKLAKEEQTKKQLKENERTERGKKALDRWNTAKEQELKSKSKEKQKIAQQKKMKEEEKRQKIIASQKVSEKWRDEKIKDLVKKQRQVRKQQKEETKKESEAKVEKKEETAAAYNAWKQKKDSIMKEQQRKQRKEKQALQNHDKQNKVEKLDDSKKAFEAWKSKKDDILKATGTMFTYKQPSKVHTQAWCPARAMKHDYPQDPTTAMLSKQKPKQTPSSRSNTPSVKSYESESFESATNSEHSFVDSDTDHDHSASESTSVSVSGRRKCIQACCQTLEYWCTCEL